jgi:sialidase-1
VLKILSLSLARALPLAAPLGPPRWGIGGINPLKSRNPTPAARNAPTQTMGRRTLCVAAAVCVVGAGAGRPAAAGTGAGPAPPALTDVFVGGQGGYACYRIPALLQIPGGALLAFAEGRKNNCNDHGYVDLVARRSADGGGTWGPVTRVYGESNATHDVTTGNPAPVYVPATGQIILPFCRNNVAALTLTSADGGETWAGPAPIPTPGDWRWVATGPPASSVLPTGRIVIPADHYGSDGLYYSHAFLSDDGGRTWALSASVRHGNEAQAVPMPWVNASTVLLSMRTDLDTRLAAVSGDGGATWSAPWPTVAETECEASTAALPAAPRGPALAMSSAFNAAARTNLTIHASRDDGLTWVPAVTVYPGDAAYSALVAWAGGAGGGVGVLFERDGYTKISFANVTVPGV